MKILFSPVHYIFDEYLLGSELYSSFQIGNRIASDNPESVIITGKKMMKEEKPYRIIEIQKQVEGFHMSIFRAMVFMCRYTVATFKILRKEKFDIIHHVRPFLIGSTFNLVLLLGLNKNIPFVIGSFSSAYHNQNIGKQRTFFERFVAFCIKPVISFLSSQTMKKADAVIVYDDATRKQALEHIGEEKIFMIPPGKDKNLYTINPEKSYEQNLEIIFVGNLIPRKGCDTLIEAFALAVSQAPHLRLRIVGDGVERERLEGLVQKFGVQEKVIFQGAVQNYLIQNFYAQAHIFASIQRESSFDQVYLEALAAGLPIITTENVASRSIIEGKDLGFVLPQENPQAVAEKMVFLSNNKDTLKKMSFNARQEFEKKYDWETVIIPKYLNVYDFVLKMKV